MKKMLNELVRYGKFAFALAFALCCFSASAATVERGGESFPSWVEFMSGVNEGDTVKLTADVTAGNTNAGQNMVKKSITIDLNGHRLYGGFGWWLDCLITVKDSSAGNGIFDLTTNCSGCSFDFTALSPSQIVPGHQLNPSTGKLGCVRFPDGMKLADCEAKIKTLVNGQHIVLEGQTYVRTSSGWVLEAALTPVADAAANCTAISDAISNAGWAGTVELSEGVFEIDTRITLNKGVTLKGQGWGKTIIKQTATDANANGGCFTIEDGARLEGVTVTGGNDSSKAGAGVLVTNGTISWCCISNNHTTAGSTSGGGVSFSGGHGTIDHSIVTANTISGWSWGGGIGGKGSNGTILIDSCLIYGNEDEAGSGGGIGFDTPVSGTKIMVRNCTITANKCSNGNGHGIYCNNGSATLTLVNDILTGNVSGTTECNTFIDANHLDLVNSSNCIVTGTATSTAPYKDASVVSALGGKGFTNVDPGFINAAANDYRLGLISAAKGAGADGSGSGVDLANKAFAATPSIGCYEYDSDAALQLGWTAAPMSASGDTICNVGDFVYGYAHKSGGVGTYTVNGVTFKTFNDGGDFKDSSKNPNVTISPDTFDWVFGLGNEGVSGDYGGMLDTAFGINSVGGPFTFTLKNLQAREKYLVQVVAHRHGQAYKVTSPDPTKVINVGGAGWTYGGSLIGVFTADTNGEYGFTLNYDPWIMLNAIQVRKLADTPPPSPPSAEWDTEHGTFAKRIAFTASGYEGSETLENFPVLVRLSESIKDFDYDDCDQSKIVFTDASGAILPYEVDTWNASGESLVWVNVASLSQDATFYMYFDGEPTEVNDATKTWTDSHYAGVWHMNEASGAVADATGHGLTATPAGNNASTESVAVSGAPTGTGRQTSTSTDKSGAYLAVAADSDLNVGNDFTMSGWVKMTAIAATGYPRLFCTKDNGTDSGWEFEMYRGNYDQLTIRGTGSATTDTKQISTLKDTWRHVVAVFDGTTATLYVDGEVVSDDIGVTNLGTGSKGLGIGNKPAGGATNNFAGDFDECRLLGAVASADWVKAEYQQSAKPKFLVAGAVETHVASTYTVSWTGGVNATVVATVDSTPIDTGDSVEDGKSVVFTVTPSSGYTYAGVSATDWTLTDDVLSRTYTVSGGALEVTIPNAVAIPTVAKPVISPTTQSFSAAFDATITCVTDGATIHYTTDGSDPTESSPTYSSAISISATTTVKAKAFKTGCTASEVATAVYTYEAPQSTDPEIGRFTATPNGSTVQFSLTGIELGSEIGVAATSYSVAYEVKNSSEVTIKAGTQFTGLTSLSCSFDVTDFADGTYTGYVTITTDQKKTDTKSAEFTINTSSEEPTLPPGWTATPMSADPSSIRTDGVLVYAYARGNYTVNAGTENEVAFSSGMDSAADIDWNLGSNVASVDPKITSDTGYNSLLKDFYSFHYDPPTLALKNLVPGNFYLVQIVCCRADQKNDYNVQLYVQESGDSSKFIQCTGSEWPYGGSLVGVFKAESSQETFHFSRVGSGQDWMAYNAIQVRDVSPVETVEPQDTPALTRQAIQDAIDRAAPVHREVKLSNGLFEIDQQLMVTNGVTLSGQGWENTIVTQVTVNAAASLTLRPRCATVDGGAKLVGLTLTGGNLGESGVLVNNVNPHEYNDVCGGGVNMLDGQISFCRITGNKATAKRGDGGGVNIIGGTIDHCIIENNESTSTYAQGGGGVAIRNPTRPVLIDSCLIVGNSASCSTTYMGGGGIVIELTSSAKDVTIRNTTVVNNRATSGYAGGMSYRQNGKNPWLKLVNTIFADNFAASLDATKRISDANLRFTSAAGDTEDIHADMSAEMFNNVFANGTPALGSGSVSLPGSGESLFVDEANGDYHLSDYSAAYASGKVYDEIGVDLDNKPFANPPSIGCYEYAGTGFVPTGSASEVRQAIQDAIDAVAPAHGTVFLGEDTFEIDQQLFVTNGVTLAGKGWEKTVIKQTGEASVYGNEYRCVTLNGQSTISGLTLTGGQVNDNGGAGAGVNVTADGGTISWCRVTGNKSVGFNGAGIGINCNKEVTVKIDHTIVDSNTNNTTAANGGGIGIYSGNRLLTVEIDTCLIYGNIAKGNGGGIGIATKAWTNTAKIFVRNTTIADNHADNVGGGIFSDQRTPYTGYNLNELTLVNDIISDNTAGVTAAIGDANIAYAGDSAADLAAFVEKNASYYRVGTAAEIGFVDAENGDYHLKADSPAIAAGSTQAGSDVDLDKVAFAATPAMGCYEYASNVAAPKFTPASGTKFDTQLEVRINGQGTVYYTTDGSVPTTESSVYSSAITISDTTQFKARAYADGVLGAVASATYVKADADAGDYYVSSTTGSDFADGLTPETAFKTIEHAVEVAKDGQKVTVLPGTFEIDETIVIDKAITVTGSGWDKTIIKPTTGKKIRLVELDGGAKLEGVTLTGVDKISVDGAAAWVKNGTISWCCITNNTSTSNSGGGAVVSFQGGQGTIDHCVVAKNTGGSNGCCGSVGATDVSGPIVIDTCLIYGNYASWGGGVGFKGADCTSDVTIRNCTIADNTAVVGGISIHDCQNAKFTIINTISVGNAPKNLYVSSNTSNLVSTQNCFIDGEAQFTNATDGDYHPSAGWDGDDGVIGAGVHYTGIGDTLDGIPFGNPPSIGCYEASYGFGKVTVSYPAKHEGEATVQIVGMSEGATSADVTFEYGADFDHLCAPITVTNGVGVAADIVATMTGLEANMEYCYRFTATENDGTDPKTFTREGTFKTTDWDVLQFSTVKVTPYSTSADASVTIMKLGLGAKKADIYVQWGADESSLGSSVRISTTAIEKQTLTYPVLNLSPNTEYLVRFTGTNDVGDVAMREARFKTTDVEHLALTNAVVSGVGQTAANIAVTVLTVGDGADTAAVTLKWAIDGSAETNTVTMSSAAFRGVTLTQAISGLTANSLYYYEIEAVSDAAVPETAKVSGKFWTDDPAIKPSDYSEEYPTTPGEGKVVTYDADNAGNEETLEPGSPYVVVDASSGYTTRYTSTVTSPGQDYYFRDAYDLQYNASARIGDKYYLFLSDAVDDAKGGEVIEVLRNNYAVEKTITITTPLTINGNGHVIKVGTPFLDNSGYVVDNPSPLHVVILCANSSDVKLSNMTVMGGGAYVGDYKYFISAICVGKQAGSTVDRSFAGSNGVLEMDHVTITRSQGGLNVAAETKCRMNACNIVRNARACGGGFYNRGLVVMENSSLSENRSLLPGGGGAACENQGALFMNNCVIVNNGSTEYGGAINMVGNTAISGSAQHAYCYMMNMTMTGNFTCNANNIGGGIGFHGTIEDTYMVNCILCNNYWYNTANGTYTDSDIRMDSGNNYFLYSVYGNIVSGSAKDINTSKSVLAADERVFKDYSSTARVYQKTDKTICEIPGPALSSAPADKLARYAPLTEDGSDADWGNNGVYTYFDASEWRSWVNDGKPNGIKMSYKTYGGEMTALGKCQPADEDHLVTTYYESAFDPMISDREIGVVGASGFGTLRQMYTLYLHEKPVNGGVSDNLTMNGISFDVGTEVTVMATPDAACTFLGWYDKTNVLVSTKSVYSFVMDSDKWLWAKFSSPSKTHTFLRILCEQKDTGDAHEHQEFPITITATWLQKQYPELCPDGIPQDEDKIKDVEALLNAPDTVNGLNHVWQNYVLGAMDPGDPDGRIWIRAEQNTDPGKLTFKMNELGQTTDCGFNVRYRLADKNIAKEQTAYDRSREYWGKTTGSFDESVTSDELKYRIIDLIFIPTGYDSSCEYVTTVNTAGVLKVDSNKKVEIISSPWVGFTPNADEHLDVKASDYVKSSCLSENDVVYIYDRAHSNYLAWAVKEGIWQQLDTYQIIGGQVYKDSSAVDSSNTNSLPRGLGAWLERSNPKAPIYLYGQVDPSPVSTTLEPGFNLVGNPYPFTYDASQLPPGEDDKGVDHTGMYGDHIVIPTGLDPINAIYDTSMESWVWASNWVEAVIHPITKEPMIDPRTKEPMTAVKSKWVSDGLILPIGHGFWYNNTSNKPIELSWPKNSDKNP